MEWIGQLIQDRPNAVAVIGLIFLAALWIYLKRRQRQRIAQRMQDAGPTDPDDMPDLTQSLKRARIQIIMSMVGLAAFTFIAIMGLFQ